MSALFILRALLTAGECFFGATLILSAGFLFTRAGTAAQRHLVWTVAFAALLALPVFAVLVPPQVVFELAAAPAAPAAPSGFGIADAILLLVAVWFAGLAFLLLKLAAGWCGLMLLKRKSVPHIPEGIDVAKFAGGPRWQVRLRTAPGEAGAMTWGVFKAVVLLPKTSVRWPRDRLQAVLLHEYAHVRRGDCLARIVAAVACALYWPNPLVWVAARRMRCDGEIAADDAVLSAGVRPSAYAEQLLSLAGANASFAGVSLSMAEPSTLKARVKAVLGAAGSRSGVTRMDVLKVAALGVAVVSALALARPSVAEARQGANTPVAARPPAPAIAVVGADPAIEASDPAEPSDAAPQAMPAPLAAPHAPAVPLAPPSAETLPPPVPPIAPLPPEPTFDMHAATTLHGAEMRRAMADFKRAQDEVRRAISQAHIQDAVAQAMKDAQLDEARRVNAQAVRQAVVRAHVAETVRKAMLDAKPAIERALAEARREIKRAAETSAAGEPAAGDADK